MDMKAGKRHEAVRNRLSGDRAGNTHSDSKKSTLTESQTPEAGSYLLETGIMKHRIPLHKLEEYLDPKSVAEIRRQATEKETGARLDAIGSSPLDYSLISNKNAENVIGFTQMLLSWCIIGCKRDL
jgi:hypothetical protein